MKACCHASLISQVASKGAMYKVKMVLRACKSGAVSHTKGSRNGSVGPLCPALIFTLRFKQTSLCGGLWPAGRTVCTAVIGLIKEPLLPRSATFSSYNNIGPQSCSNSTAAFLPRSRNKFKMNSISSS